MKINIAPKVFAFTRVVFGVNAPPYLAQFVAYHNAKLKGSELPRAVEAVRKSTYMDDSLHSVETVEKAIKLHHHLTILWKRAGKAPRKWLSNCEQVLKMIPQEYRVANLDLEAHVMPFY
ncbi:uncharacterized protein [Montipora foliosa]|uniref:uncharacterized protein n=1 Tax=Montipora foliosa TaxID=591990 RepID=UPI0035F174F0